MTAKFAAETMETGGNSNECFKCPKEKNCLPIIVGLVQVTFRNTVENIKADLGRQKNNIF